MFAPKAVSFRIRQQLAWLINTMAPFHTKQAIRDNWPEWSRFINEVLGVTTTCRGVTGANVVYTALDQSGFYTVKALPPADASESRGTVVDAATVSVFRHHYQFHLTYYALT
jgi:hypothetical protein